MNSPLFRKQALDRLASPDGLDQATRLTAPREWLALAALAALLALATAWAVWGSYRVTVHGDGMLHAESGHFLNIFAPKSGWIDYLAPVGGRIRPGELIAKLNAPENKRQLTESQAKLDHLQARRAAVSARFDARLTREGEAAALRRAGLNETIELTSQRIAALERSAAEVADGAERLFAARDQLARAKAELGALELALQASATLRDQEMETLDREVAESSAEIAQAYFAFNLATQILARDDGRVMAAPITPHSLVSVGQRLLTIESGGPGLEVLAYIPAEQGKSVRLGMPARVQPSTAMRDEFGAMVGRIVWVSPLPQARADIADTLSQEDLAAQFTAKGPPIAVRIALVPDPRFANGYRWTSTRGGEVRLTSGMLVTAWVTIREAPPITLVIPVLRGWLGL